MSESIRTKQAKIGILGLGYVGLPLGMAFAEAGFQVTGLEIDTAKVEQLNRGHSYIRHIPSEELAPLMSSGRLTATVDSSVCPALDCMIICVPTPLNASREPDLSYVIQAGEMLSPHVRPGQLYVLVSTTYPGTTEEVLMPILERGGLKAGVDFHLAFSPEREDPGNKDFNTRTIPKLVGGHTSRCLEVAQQLFSSVLKNVIPVSSMKVAEMAKLHENIFRAVNIGMVNELKILCERMGIDVWEVINAASTKPFGFMPFYPGPGLGGHCIPIDPFYLTWKARQYSFNTRFIELAGEINSQMPSYTVARTMEALNHRSKSLKGARLLVLGVAYKKDVDDLRESPSLQVLQLLAQKGARLEYHDPYIDRLQPGHGFTLDMASVPLEYDQLGEYDAVLILTDHSSVNYERVVSEAQLVVDTRNATRGIRRGRESIVQA
ncbi:nucleotide sugar dehydrogenase [Corallococcus sp. RDP092CA]|uniref:nucleotide sugar dehydrogenase n=1 Tax=Corallococcus sp. RDP092CA TaxID=3109369 RepID=UPI0035ADED87